MIIKINSICVSDTTHQGEAKLAANQLDKATGQPCYVLQGPTIDLTTVIMASVSLPKDK